MGGQHGQNAMEIAPLVERDSPMHIRNAVGVLHSNGDANGDSSRGMMRREHAKIAKKRLANASRQSTFRHIAGGPRVVEAFEERNSNHVMDHKDVVNYNHRQRSLFKTPQQQRSDIMIPEEFVHTNLKEFQAGSLNSEKYPELQIVGAGLLPKQILDIMTYHASTPAVPLTVVTGFDDVVKHTKGSRASMKRLESMLTHRGSDKARHGYHAFYASILDALAASNKDHVATLEIGLGTNNSKLVSSMGQDGTPGASNRAFRDYLPEKAHVYGADVDRDILYQEERIKTAYVNQLDMTSFETMTKQLGQANFDLIVDDGLHALSANLNVLLFGLKHVRPGGWVVIEDIEPRHFAFWSKFVDVILGSNQALRTAYYRFTKTDCYLVHKIS